MATTLNLRFRMALRTGGMDPTVRSVHLPAAPILAELGT
jgi:hypothetical protein